MLCPRLRFLHSMVAIFVIAASHTHEITNFFTTNLLYDGELETFIYYDGVSAKETTVTKG